MSWDYEEAKKEMKKRVAHDVVSVPHPDNWPLSAESIEWTFGTKGGHTGGGVLYTRKDAEELFEAQENRQITIVDD